MQRITERTLIVLAVALLLPGGTRAEDPDCSLATTAVQAASSVRNLKVLQPVPCQLKNKPEVEHYLREKLRNDIPEDKIRNEERLFKILGVLPEDFDYLNGLVSLYTEQVAGYYDADQKYYAMARWIPPALQLPIAVHELTHALQDQHFDLKQYTHDSIEMNDRSLARAALVEGDASAVMIDYSRKIMGQQSLAQESTVSGVVMQHLLGTTLTPSLHSAPAAVQALIIFPYLSGLNFVHALLKDGGYRRVSEAYKNPPQTTEEILHPEHYLRGEHTLPAVDLTETRRALGVNSENLLYADTLGEFTTSALLSAWLRITQASGAAAGWDGDRAEIHRSSPGMEVALWVTGWDSAKDAEEFFAALTQAYRLRFRQSGDRNPMEFETERYGKVVIRREQHRVFVSFGPFAASAGASVP